MEKAAYIVVFITTANTAEAEKISRLLVEQKKAACVNIVPKVDSRYWWTGKIETAEESLLIVKTKASLLQEIIALVKREHSYSVPEIIALPVLGGNTDYLEWLERSVS